MFFIRKQATGNHKMQNSSEECQTFVLNTIKRYKVISALEMTYYTKIYSLSAIEKAATALWKKNLVFLSSDGGYPKRYKPREEKSENDDIFSD
jgi:hypothetical protein